MKEYDSFFGRGGAPRSRRKTVEPSHGAENLKAIRRELAEVQTRLKDFEDEKLRQRERELLFMEEKYRVYDKRFKWFVRRR